MTLPFSPPTTSDEDSPDLTDAEVRTAIATTGTDDIIAWIKTSSCQKCGKEVRVVAHEFRRRALKLYWRIQMVCLADHPTSQVFKADWVKS
jgi:hypothetical protein